VEKSPYLWTAACGAARTFSRRSRWARLRSAIGRPHAWGLAAFGQPGVEAVLEILRRELRTIMRQAGTVSVDKNHPRIYNAVAITLPPRRGKSFSSIAFFSCICGRMKLNDSRR